MSRQHFLYRAENIEKPTDDELRSLADHAGQMKPLSMPWRITHEGMVYYQDHFIHRIPPKAEIEDCFRYAVAAVNSVPRLLDENQALRKLVRELHDELASHLEAFGFSEGAEAKLRELLARAKLAVGK